MGKLNPYIFREYDIRGVVDKDLTDDVVELLGKGIGTFLKRKGARTLAIGGDIRLSTERLRENLMRGITATGVNVINLGQVPTPVQYFSLHKLNVDGGVQITGSHNPPEFNGFKISFKTDPVYGEDIQRIRALMEQEDFEKGTGSIDTYHIIPDYIADITQRIQLKRPVKVIIDCGNGAASLVAGELFTRLGADVQFLYCEPDGRFPNHHPDPVVLEYIQDLIRQTRESDAELGIGFDGDADRIGVIDGNGEVIWGDRLMIIFARDILKDHPGAQIIFDVKCSQALPEAIEKAGGKPIMWKTGHSLLKKKMKETGALLGGEMSGHIVFAHNFYGFDDAIYSAARLLEILSRDTKPIRQYLADVPEYFATPEIRAEVADDQLKFEMARKAAEYFKQNYEVVDIDGVRILFGDGWGLVRPSNTQPVIVLRFEARTPERLEEIKNLVISKLKEFGEIKL